MQLTFHCLGVSTSTIWKVLTLSFYHTERRSGLSIILIVRCGVLCSVFCVMVTYLCFMRSTVKIKISVRLLRVTTVQPALAILSYCLLFSN